VSIASWLQGMREGLLGFRNAMRASSLMGRAFRLRDRGQLDEALTVCGQALDLAGPLVRGHEPSSLGTLVVGALTVDEVAWKLGRPRLALEPLANALIALQQFNQKTPSRKNDLLIRYEQQVQERLENLRRVP